MMSSQLPLVAGLAVGASVAMPVGPMSLLCIQRTLVSGMRVGVSTGLGAATVNVAYGALVIGGLDRAAPLLAGSGAVLNLVGGLFLLWCAVRTVLRRRRATEAETVVAISPAAAYGSAAMFNATNPMSPMLIVALLGPVVAACPPSPDQAALLLLGMFTAASFWWVCLSGGVALMRARLSPRVLGVVNQLAGLLLAAYGVLALLRATG